MILRDYHIASHELYTRGHHTTQIFERWDKKCKSFIPLLIMDDFIDILRQQYLFKYPRISAQCAKITVNLSKEKSHQCSN